MKFVIPDPENPIVGKFSTRLRGGGKRKKVPIPFWNLTLKLHNSPILLPIGNATGRMTNKSFFHEGTVTNYLENLG